MFSRNRVCTASYNIFLIFFAVLERCSSNHENNENVCQLYNNGIQTKRYDSPFLREIYGNLIEPIRSSSEITLLTFDLFRDEKPFAFS
ncbi:unnamed protein product [Rhizophagus irregularis]|nr:unnamed protein product [Rhizophagus irregularis]